MAQSDLRIPTFKLNDGRAIQQLAFGVGTALARPGDESAASAVVESIKQAIKLGYRHFDAAENYKNEAELGRAIRESNVPREELFITTKIGRQSKDVAKALDASLERLGMDYVDLYLVHSPFFEGTDEETKLQRQERWKQMEKLRESGKARSIGVSNYMPHHLDDTLATASIVPAVNQIEFHAYLQRRTLVPFQQSKGILMEAYGPMGPLRGGAGGPLDPVLQEMASRYSVSESEICLRYVIDKGGVAITTSTKEQRMRDYLRVLSFRLTAEDIAKVDQVGDQKHYRGFFVDRIAPDDRT